jgi:hypothetical protein
MQITAFYAPFAEHIINRAEFPPKWRFFTQRYRRRNVSGYGQGIYEIQRGICPFRQNLVY